MDGYHRRRAIEVVMEEDGIPWTDEQFQGHHQLWCDCVLIQHAKEITAGKVSIKCPVRVQKYPSFVDSRKALLNHAGPLKLEYGVKLFDSSSNDIVDDMP